jgi:cell division initiation protein
MALTPVEIRHVRLKRRLLGYERAETDELLELIAASFEDVWRERADLRDALEDIEGELTRQKEIETALRNTLISAERMADDIRSQARREAEVVIAEARAQARDIIGSAHTERERLKAEIRRLRGAETDLRAEYRAFLRAALERLDLTAEDRAASGQAA